LTKEIDGHYDSAMIFGALGTILGQNKQWFSFI